MISHFASFAEFMRGIQAFLPHVVLDITYHKFTNFNNFNFREIQNFLGNVLFRLKIQIPRRLVGNEDTEIDLLVMW